MTDVQLQQRIDKIFQVNVMSIDQWDFMATHVPFQSLAVQYDGNTGSPIERMSEDNAYNQLVRNEKNLHRMIIVRGHNGSGKSNLIRWMRARHGEENKDGRNHMIFLRRVNNSLKGLMRQLLEQGAVVDAVQSEKIRMMLDAPEQLSGEKLKLRILNELSDRIDLDTDECFPKARRRQIIAFLNDNAIRDGLRQPGGTVERIFSHLTGSQGGGQDDAKFLDSDLTLLTHTQLGNDGARIPDIVAASGSRESQRIFNQYCTSEEWPTLVNYFNRHIPAVLRACSQVAQGDSEEIIRQLRVALQKEGRSLTVMIEDITKFRGMDAELVKILSESHGGENSDLCPITSVIGTTDSYYQKEFLGNFQNRVTHQICIDSQTLEGSLGDEMLAMLAARYINAAYLSEDEVKSWYLRGQDQTLLPIASRSPGYPWETVTVYGKEYSLYPFNHNALQQIFKHLPEKTPRILLNVIRQQLWHFIFDLNFPEVSSFTSPPLEMASREQEAAFEKQNLPVSIKARALTLLCAWGDGTVALNKSKGYETIGGIPTEFIQKIGLGALRGAGATSQPDPPPKPGPATPPSGPAIPPSQRLYMNRIGELKEWYRNNERLGCSEDMKRLVVEFISDSIYWQCEGVPAYIIGQRLKDIGCIFIEGQMQIDPGPDKVILTIQRSDTAAYMALTALTEYDYHKSWDFPEASLLQLMLVSWLEQIREDLIKKVKGNALVTKEMSLEWALSLEFTRLGLIGALTPDDTSEIILAKLLKPVPEMKKRLNTSKWATLQQVIERRNHELDFNKELIQSLPNSHMGNVREFNGLKKLNNRMWLDESLARMEQLDWDASSSIPSVLPDGVLTNPAKLLGSIANQAKKVVSAELFYGNSLLDELKKHLGSLDEKSWYEAAGEIDRFLQRLQSSYHIATDETLSTGLVMLKENASILAFICTETKTLYQAGDSAGFAKSLRFLSGDPCNSLAFALKLFTALSDLSETLTRQADEDLANMQSSSVPADELDQLVKDITEIIGQLIKIGDVPNAQG